MLKIAKNKLITVAFGILFTLIAVLFIYYFTKYQTLSKQVHNGGQEDVQSLIAKVSKHVLLPEGETPTVMTVTDKEKSTSKQFFANAKNGDKVLVYMQAKKAFLYDVASDRILEIGPVLTDASMAATVGTATAPTPTPQTAGYTFVLYNGTTKVGLTKTYTPIVEDKIAGAKVIDTDNASRNDYEKSLLVDLKGTRGTDVQTISQTLGIASGTLPDGETATQSADFLIIFGADKK